MQLYSLINNKVGFCVNLFSLSLNVTQVLVQQTLTKLAFKQQYSPQILRMTNSQRSVTTILCLNFEIQNSHLQVVLYRRKNLIRRSKTIDGGNRSWAPTTVDSSIPPTLQSPTSRRSSIWRCGTCCWRTIQIWRWCGRIWVFPRSWSIFIPKSMRTL